MSKENRVINLQITLKGKEKERFLLIKELKGLSNDEALRLMINEYFEKKLAGNKTCETGRR